MGRHPERRNLTAEGVMLPVKGDVEVYAAGRCTGGPRVRSPMKSSTRSGHVVHSSERSDASEIIVR